jgi:hypothetical protein
MNTPPEESLRPMFEEGRAPDFLNDDAKNGVELILSNIVTKISEMKSVSL